MKAAVRWFDSPDGYDLKKYRPEAPDHFAFHLEVLVGAIGEPGEDAFQMTVCTPSWLKARLQQEPIIVGRHYLVVAEYDFDRIEKFIRDYIDKLEEPDWPTLGEKIGRLGMWEFEDYRPRP